MDSTHKKKSIKIQHSRTRPKRKGRPSKKKQNRMKTLYEKKNPSLQSFNFSLSLSIGNDLKGLWMLLTRVSGSGSTE